MIQNVVLIHFNVKELTQYTNEFANQLGQKGGFGNTFCGTIPENNHHNFPVQNVAMKRSHFKNSEDVQLYEVLEKDLLFTILAFIVFVFFKFLFFVFLLALFCF